MLDFLGIGAQKAGTSWIYQNLLQHPEVAFPAGKEIHFWDKYRERGIEWYTNLFPEALGRKQGEVTPAYAFQDVETIREVYKLNPKLRLIFSIRNPIDRAWSSAKMALKRAEMTIEEASDQWFIDHFYSQGSLKRGDYLRCLSNWLEVFPEEQLLVVHYEDIAKRPEQVLEACCNHIGVKPSLLKVVNEERVNQGIKSELRPALWPVLEQIYAKKIEGFNAVITRWKEDTARLQNYIMLFEGGMGSSMLIDRLSSHPCIVAKPECLVRKTEAEQSNWLDGLYSGSDNPLIQAIGFKTKLRDVENPGALREFLKERDIKVIHLSRQNLVKLTLSQINAKRLFEQTKQWNREDNHPELPPVHISLEHFEKELVYKRELQDKLQEYADTLSVPVLPITYEQMLGSPESVFNSIFSFLGVTPYPLEGRLRINTPDDLQKAIVNYDELKAYYKNSELESMFEA